MLDRPYVEEGRKEGTSLFDVTMAGGGGDGGGNGPCIQQPPL